MPALRKPCLILDHDDTVVSSTADIHYPAYLEAMRVLRPGVSMSLREYFIMNCDPGIFSYYQNVVKLSREELKTEFGIWRGIVAERVPRAFPGMKRIIETQRALGGRLVVVTHSEPDHVTRDWEKNGLPLPDLIFGGSVPEEQRKPSPWPVLEALRQLDMRPEDAVVVDDLLPGLRMAQAAGVDFLAACWSHDIPEIDGVFRKEGQRCFGDPEQLWQYLFE